MNTRGRLLSAVVVAGLVVGLASFSSPAEAGGALSPGARICFGVTGRPGDVAVVNLTPVQAAGPGFGLLVSSDIGNPPVASNVNFTPGSIDPNVAFAPIGADGKVCYINSVQSQVDLVADHLGTIASGSFTNANPDGSPRRT
ncbi:MAG TPA: hypothetical protein VHN36_18105, partial [Ilumatobacteraceae bacterium]|nr:hypothetical protein [Ilumatobacteraceae bacterium]